MRGILIRLLSPTMALTFLTGCVPDGPRAFTGFSGTGSSSGGAPSGGSSGPAFILPTSGAGGSGNDGGYITPTTPPSSGDHGYIAPTNFLFCGETGQIVLQKGQRTLLSWAYPNGYVPSQPLQLELESTPSGIADIGTVTADTILSAWYQAPASVAVEFSVNVRALLPDTTTPAVCTVKLIADTGLGIEDDGTTRGSTGNVYPLPVNTPQLPDFSQMTSVAQILVPNFDVPARSFDAGFPGVTDLFEWFGIRFEGRLIVPTTGTYGLRLTSDDGSILWIDGVQAVNNDGVHAPATVSSTRELTEGTHTFRLDYYQGPRYQIALQWLWKKPGDTSFVLVPPDNILRPAP